MDVSNRERCQRSGRVHLLYLWKMLKGIVTSVLTKGKKYEVGGVRFATLSLWRPSPAP